MFRVDKCIQNRAVTVLMSQLNPYRQNCRFEYLSLMLTFIHQQFKVSFVHESRNFQTVNPAKVNMYKYDFHANKMLRPIYPVPSSLPNTVPGEIELLFSKYHFSHKLRVYAQSAFFFRLKTTFVIKKSWLGNSSQECHH